MRMGNWWSSFTLTLLGTEVADGHTMTEETNDVVGNGFHLYVNGEAII